MTAEERDALRARGDYQITIGILLASLCGLCSGVVALNAFLGRDSEGLIIFHFMPVVGGLPILVGVILIAVGYLNRARANRGET